MILQRIMIILGDAGFEPATSAPEVWCATNEPPYTYHHFNYSNLYPFSTFRHWFLSTYICTVQYIDSLTRYAKRFYRKYTTGFFLFAPGCLWIPVQHGYLENVCKGFHPTPSHFPRASFLLPTQYLRPYPLTFYRSFRFSQNLESDQPGEIGQPGLCRNLNHRGQYSLGISSGNSGFPAKTVGLKGLRTRALECFIGLFHGRFFGTSIQAKSQQVVI